MLGFNLYGLFLDCVFLVIIYIFKRRNFFNSRKNSLCLLERKFSIYFSKIYIFKYGYFLINFLIMKIRRYIVKF